MKKLNTLRVVVLLAAAFVLVAHFLTPDPTRAANGSISGTLTESDGTTPVVGAWISVYDATYVYYFYASTDDTGAYSIADVPAGTYTLSVWSGHASEGDPPTQSITVADDATTTVNLELVAKNVTFTLVDSDGTTPVVGATYWAYSSDWSFYVYGMTDAEGDGGFSVTTNGDYSLEFSLSGLLVNGVASKQTFTYSGSTVPLGTIQLSAPAARIKVLNPDDTPSQYANVSVYDSTYSWSGSWWGQTDVDGVAAVGALAAGTYTVHVSPPWQSDGQTLIAPDPVTITVATGTTNTVYYDTPIEFSQATKTINGVVEFEDGTPVSGAQYSGWQLDGSGYLYGEADENGEFTAMVGKGSYEVSVWNNSYGNTDETAWGYTGTPVRVTFEAENDVEESEAVSFSVIAFDAYITGTLLDPDGNVLSEYAGVTAWKGNVFSWDDVDFTTGAFSLAVPAGTYNLSVYGGSEQFGTPAIDPVAVAAGETVDLGELRMVERDATITGRVSDGNGTGLEGMYVNTWSASGNDWGWAQTDPSGDYTIYVVGGRQMEVAAFPGWDGGDGVSYVNTTPPQRVTVAANSSETVNWVFETTDALITGAMVDEDGETLTNIYGWIDASIASENTGGDWWGGLGASVDQGTYSIDVVGGKTWQLSTWLPYGADYSVSSGTSVEVAEGETVENANITLLRNDVNVSGQLIDENGDPVTNLGYAEVFAQNGAGGYQWAMVNSDGTYSLKICAGTWTLTYALPYDSDYIASYTAPTIITVESGDNVTQDLTVLEADSEIQVTVTDANGDPVPNAWINISTDLAGQADSGVDPFGYYGRGNLTDENGEQTISVPGDITYFVSAYVPSSLSGTLVAPAATTVTPTESDPAEVAIQFIEPDVTVTGTLELGESEVEALTAEGVEGVVWAYSSEGQSVDVDAAEDGTYTLMLTSGTTWTIGAEYEDGDYAYSVTPFELTPEEDTDVDQTITLDSTPEETLPDTSNQTVAAENSMAMELGENDEFSLFAPARSLSSENDTDVSVTVTPMNETPTQAGDQPLGIAYDVEGTIASGGSQGQAVTDLDGVATFTFTYDEADLPDGIDESEIFAGYYDESAQVWRPMDNITVDEDTDTVTATDDHFTVFSLLTPNGSAESNDVDPEDPEEEDPGEEVPDDSNPAATDHSLLLTPVVNGGAHYRVFDEAAEVVGDFFAYGSALRGEFHAVGADIDGDGEKEVITSTGIGMGDQVRAFEQDGTFLGHFFAYDAAFRGGVQIAAGDMDNDGDDEVITIPQRGASNLTVWEYDGSDSEQRFSVVDRQMVYDDGYRGGSMLATGDFNGDDTVDVAIATSESSGNVQVYELTDGELTRMGWFEPYGSGYAHGVRLAAGDTDGDGMHELITANEEGRSNLRVYSWMTDTEEFAVDAWTFVYDEGFQYGMTVSSADMDGDGNAEVVVAPKRRGGPNVRVFRAEDTDLTLVDWVMAYDDQFDEGVNVALVDVDDDQMAELITGTRAGHPNVQILDLESDELTVQNWFWAFNEVFEGGVNVQY